MISYHENPLIDLSLRFCTILSSWLQKVFFSLLNHFSNGNYIETCRTESIVWQETYVVGLVLIHSPSYWQLWTLCRMLHIIMCRVQKETSTVISLIYIFCIGTVDFFFFGWNLFEMIKDILQSTQI